MRRAILWLVVSVVLGSFPLAAQTNAAPSATAPQQSVTAPAQTQSEPQTLPAPQMPPAPMAPSPPQLPTTGAVRRLTVQDAEALALKNNPQISVYHLLALASQQVTREAEVGLLPDHLRQPYRGGRAAGSRIAAGNLNTPRLYERAAGGLALSQLITDFGRTNNLVATAALRAKAANMNAAATAYQIKLAVDQAFYNALQTFA